MYIKCILLLFHYYLNGVITICDTSPHFGHGPKIFKGTLLVVDFSCILSGTIRM